MLQGFLSTTHKERISSVSHAGKKSTSRKIYGARSKTEVHGIVVAECDDHSSPVSFVKVELHIMTPGKGFKSVGVAKVCPLCWFVLEWPEGMEVA